MKYVDHRESLERDHVAKSSVHEWGGFTERECWEEAAVLHRYVGDPHMCVRTPTKAGERTIWKDERTHYLILTEG